MGNTILLDAVLDYAAKGWAIFPCRESGPESKWKSPYSCDGLWNGLKDASTDPELIRFWWTKWPNAMIGAPVSHKLVVLDVDPRYGGSTDALFAGHEPTPTLTCLSGRNDGGMHLYYLHPGGGLTGVRLPRGVDLRNGGKHYCIVPPSIHPATGEPYRWYEPENGIAALPGHLEALLRPKVAPVRPLVRTGDGKGLVEFVAAQQEGNRNEGLFWAAMRAKEEGVLDEIADSLVSAAASIGLSRLEAERTVESARNRQLASA